MNDSDGRRDDQGEQRVHAQCAHHHVHHAAAHSVAGRVDEEAERAVAQVERDKRHEQEARGEAHVVVAKLARVVYKEGIERHHQERDDLAANVANGIHAHVLDKLAATRGLLCVRCFRHAV